MKILVVDDAAFMRMMIKDILVKNGFEVVGEASNGAEAVIRFGELEPDLVTMDITMPEMDGITALKEIRKTHPNLPVVLITGNPMVVAQSSEFPLLPKPIVSRDLHAALQRYLGPVDDDKVVPLFGQGGRRSP